MLLEIQIVIAFLLDQLCGDPRVLPHPVRFIGRLAAVMEKLFRNYCSNMRFAGGCAVCMVLLVTGTFVYGVIFFAGQFAILQNILEIYFLFAAIAAHDLARHSSRVYRALSDHDLPKARKEVAMIVGRDTTALDEKEVSRACVESVAENLVDGVTAPLFWAVIGGPVAAMIYKAVNTMDSIFGYKNEKYLEFGWAAAKLDDLVNYVPARITAFLIMAAAGILRLNMRQSFRTWLRDRYNHASPNSGQSEAAAAGALGVQLGGESIYFGKTVTKPTIGDAELQLSPCHIMMANKLMLASSVLAGMIFVMLRCLFL